MSCSASLPLFLVTEKAMFSSTNGFWSSRCWLPSRQSPFSSLLLETLVILCLHLHGKLLLLKEIWRESWTGVLMITCTESGGEGRRVPGPLRAYGRAGLEIFVGRSAASSANRFAALRLEHPLHYWKKVLVFPGFSAASSGWPEAPARCDLSPQAALPPSRRPSSPPPLSVMFVGWVLKLL